MFQFAQYTWSKQDSFHYKRDPWIIVKCVSPHDFSYYATSFYFMPRPPFDTQKTTLYEIRPDLLDYYIIKLLIKLTNILIY